MIKVLQILALILGLVVVGNAQLECFWGIEVYVRDSARQEIRNNNAVLTASREWFDLPYRFRNDHHTWTRGTVHGIPSINYSLRVSAEGYKNFEKQINVPECGIKVFELRLQPKESNKEAIFEELTRLQIFTENVGDEQIEKIILTNKEGRFESVKEYGGKHIAGVKNGSYLLQFVKADGSILTDFKELKLEKRTVILEVTLSVNEQTSAQNKELVCKYPKADLDDWKVCGLTIGDSKFSFLTRFAGKVSNEKGEPLSGTKIIIKDKDGNFFQTTTKDGKFDIELPIGVYEVEFNQNGDFYPPVFSSTKLKQKLPMDSDFIDVIIKRNKQ